MIRLPHKWPGNEKLRVILAALRLLGIETPVYWKDGQAIPYDRLPKRYKRERWEDFRTSMHNRMYTLK